MIKVMYHAAPLGALIRQNQFGADLDRKDRIFSQFQNPCIFTAPNLHK